MLHFISLLPAVCDQCGLQVALSSSPLDYPGGLRFPDNWLMPVLGSNMAITDVVQNTSPHLQPVQQKESLL